LLGGGLLAACGSQAPPAEPVVRGEVSVADAPWRIELRTFALPETGDKLNHFTYGLNMGKDGFLYLGIGNNRDNSHLFRFDPRSERFENLGDFRAALPLAVFAAGNFGKFHVGPYQDAAGAVWVASHPREYWAGAPAGRLFRSGPERGMQDAALHLQDLGPTPGNQGVYFMAGDDRHGALYLALRNSHFAVYDLASGSWRDLGRFSSRAPFIGLFDTSGRLYLYGYDGAGDWSAGPPTISRYDPRRGTLETSRSAPPTLWVGAVTPDGETAYTTSYRRGDLYRWHFDQWPDYRAEALGRIDPRGRAVFSNDLSLVGGGRLLVVAGTVESRFPRLRGNEHGVWVYDLDAGRSWQVARLEDALSRSMGISSERHCLYWTNAGTVDADGWIWIGVSTMPSDDEAIARLVGIRVSAKTAGAGRAPL
jgi:hypothetical protein